jgi:hypothetical protein
VPKATRRPSRPSTPPSTPLSWISAIVSPADFALALTGFPFAHRLENPHPGSSSLSLERRAWCWRYGNGSAGGAAQIDLQRGHEQVTTCGLTCPMLTLPVPPVSARGAVKSEQLPVRFGPGENLIHRVVRILPGYGSRREPA